MTGPADAFHWLVRDTAAAVGVRWSRRVGYADGSLLALASSDTREGLVLAVQDTDGDSTASGLSRDDAAALRDALDDWLEETA